MFVVTLSDPFLSVFLANNWYSIFILFFHKGGDREPPEHGLKRYWKEKPKSDNPTDVAPGFVPSYKILQTAASSAGLSSVMHNIENEAATTPTKRQRRQQGTNEAKKKELPTANSRFITILTDANDPASTLGCFF